MLPHHALASSPALQIVTVRCNQDVLRDIWVANDWNILIALKWKRWACDGALVASLEEYESLDVACVVSVVNLGDVYDRVVASRFEVLIWGPDRCVLVRPVLNISVLSHYLISSPFAFIFFLTRKMKLFTYAAWGVPDAGFDPSYTFVHFHPLVPRPTSRPHMRPCNPQFIQLHDHHLLYVARAQDRHHQAQRR
jgi:hypothetical protein